MLVALRRPEFSIAEFCAIVGGNRMQLTPAELTYHIRRHQAEVLKLASVWISPEIQRELGIDEHTGQFIRHLNATMNDRARQSLLQEMYEREVDFLDASNGRLPVSVKRDVGAVPGILMIEKMYSHWLKNYRAFQTALGAAQTLLGELQSTPDSVRAELFNYFGARTLGKQLGTSLDTPNAAKVLTACIISAERVNVGSERYRGDESLRGDVFALL